MAKKELTPKQAAFVREFMIDRNATQAATRAGYSARTANEQGARLLANASVSEAIASAEEKLAKKALVTAEMVIKGLLDEALADDGREGKSGRIRAWELLGKHLGILNDKSRVELSGSIDVELSAHLERFNKLAESRLRQTDG